MGKLILRDYSSEDKAALVRLLQDGLSKDFSMERWDWLHHNEVTLGSHIVVAEYDGKIVGTVGAIKKRFVYNSEEFVGGRHIDPVVDKSMRGKGVFPKMLNALNEMCTDVNFSYTFPNAASFKGFDRTGYISLGPLLVPVCQLSFFNTTFKEKIRYLGTGVKIVGENKNINTASFDELEGLTATPRPDKYALKRDYNYVRGRYAASPVRSYELLVSKIDAVIQNACILEHSQNVSIIDLVEYGSEICLPEYLKAIRKLYGKVAVNVWNNSLPDVDRYFLGKSIQNFLVRKGNLKMPESFFSKENWYLTKGEVESN